MCGCEICKRHRAWKERGVPDDIIDYILDLELDLDFWKAIKDGNWPNGKEVLLRALEKYTND